MPLTIQDSRILLKRSTVTTEVPTVAPSNDHTDGTWGTLDIYVGELFCNVEDRKLWLRYTDSIDQIVTVPIMQSGIHTYANASGTDTYTATLTPALEAYATGNVFAVKFANANTGAATININSLGAKDLKLNGSALSASAITANVVYLLAYNGTNFDIIGGSSVSYLPLAGGSMSGAINEAKGADIASAATTDIGAATGNYVKVTGTTTITALGTIQAGTRRIVEFTGSLTLTHNGTSLILPNAANIKTVAGDTATFVSLGSGNWKCASYSRTGAHHGNVTVTSGTSFTTPSNTDINTVWRIWLVGGGGGGAGMNTTNQTAPGGGGGGGCYVTLTGLTGGTTYTCAIGTGGTAGAATPTNGGNGGTTSLTIGGTTYTAGGGDGAVSGASTSGGIGGIGTNGDLNVRGGSGGDSPIASAGSTDGQGGFPPFGFGIGGKCVRTNQPGIDGRGYGGGGSGAKGTSVAGGAGSDGIIFAEWNNY